MTTLTDLAKIAEKSFNNQMRRRGFAVEKRFYFWRKRVPLFDVIWSEIVAGGAHLRTYATILSPWIDSDDGQFDTFPVSVSLIGGQLYDQFPENLSESHVFDVLSQEQINLALKEMLEIIDRGVVPWFDSITSCEAYVGCIDGRSYDPSKARRERIKRGLTLGFAKEKDFFQK